ncbi:hypothetical protein P692DRAFT_20823436 [Suillus brevipes Sb2]|nr:hypothetical protein P692DRAFT_20823436 [Suillus brevipes Sb2]
MIEKVDIRRYVKDPSHNCTSEQVSRGEGKGAEPNTSRVATVVCWHLELPREKEHGLVHRRGRAGSGVLLLLSHQPGGTVKANDTTTGGVKLHPFVIIHVSVPLAQHPQRVAKGGRKKIVFVSVEVVIKVTVWIIDWTAPSAGKMMRGCEGGGDAEYLEGPAERPWDKAECLEERAER